MVQRLAQEFPGLRLGGASVRCAAGLEAVAAAGLGYAVSPILEHGLLQRAEALGLPLVPGVFSPTEVAAAVRWGARAVKLYPAAALPPGYWASLRGPLGPLPFCIAAGRLAPADGAPWLQAGVDAIALGGQLFAASAMGPQVHPGLAPLLAWLRSRVDA
jgi:2-dehydro-3-deoxyphosphogluconate aldolase/(4S)-4-hydroxy-2-oxoglutarate aldolase